MFRRADPELKHPLRPLVRDLAARGFRPAQIHTITAGVVQRTQAGLPTTPAAPLAGFDPARIADYLSADHRGEYPDGTHAMFGVDMQTFSDATGQRRRCRTAADGRERWSWVPRPATNFGDDDEEDEEDDDEEPATFAAYHTPTGPSYREIRAAQSAARFPKPPGEEFFTTGHVPGVGGIAAASSENPDTPTAFPAMSRAWPLGIGSEEFF